MNTLRVRAVEGRKLPAINADGLPLQGRFVGYDRRGAIIQESDGQPGVPVPADSYHLRAVKNGDLEEVS